MVDRKARLQSIPLFEDPPDVELLQWLARGSLKQNLARAIRLWVWLHSLYGDEHERLELPKVFTYKGWRDAFFSPSHPKGEAQPNLHDANCACVKLTTDWLFTEKTGQSEMTWREAIQQHSAIADSTLDNLLQSRLFAVTRRSLFGDLEMLVELGWLHLHNSGYQRVEQLPRRPLRRETQWVSNEFGIYDLGFLSPNLETVAQTLAQPIQEVQRFYLEADYIIAHTQERVERWLERFKEIWESAPLPVQLQYASARYGITACVVYPVCIYYSQRALYLCAFGETPSQTGEWYNYRLDKLQQLHVLTWADARVPHFLRRRRHSLPQPNYIQTQLHHAWGFDYYLPDQLMLLRFDRQFHDRYIAGTFRHKTFHRITHDEAIHVVQEAKRRSLLKLIQSRPAEDAYYTVIYREGDTNVGLRLRSWRPNVEVLLPWKLRQTILANIQAEWQFYQ
jgi:CRISPR-associated protein (TIGR03985 family)